MFSRLIVGIKNFSKLSSIFDHIDYVNNRHISKLLDFFIIRRIDVRFCNNVIHYLCSNVQNLGLNEINSLVKNVLFTNYTLNSCVLNDILSILIEKYRFDQILSLDIFYHLLLLDSRCCMPSNKCVEFLHNFRLSSDCVEQLNLLNVFSVIQFFRTDITSSYTPQQANYVKYLKLLSPKILLRSGLYGETDDIIHVKKIMDKLNVEYVSGITGIKYLQIKYN
ncbi:hypothetical protein MACJ_003404 [Theileria orientalis]|uniref:Uncharacterized protein n=1 Tax=Theileria orientalis TaxID=68886 RepID=A0A976SK90_THEOR|nr:hypothetical protein MACJ_003404 [Theileria orientalis]